MRVTQIVEPLKAEVVVGERMEEQDIEGGYCGDLLSDCIANAKEGSVWVTIQSHPNTVAVAVLVGIPCIVVSNYQEINEETRKRAQKEGVTILRTSLTSYQAVSVLFSLGIPGTKRHG